MRAARLAQSMISCIRANSSLICLESSGVDDTGTIVCFADKSLTWLLKAEHSTFNSSACPAAAAASANAVASAPSPAAAAAAEENAAGAADAAVEDVAETTPRAPCAAAAEAAAACAACSSCRDWAKDLRNSSHSRRSDSTFSESVPARAADFATRRASRSARFASRSARLALTSCSCNSLLRACSSRTIFRQAAKSSGCCCCCCPAAALGELAAAAAGAAAALAAEAHAADADAVGANVGGLGKASADDRGAVHGVHPTGEVQVRIDGQLASHSTSHPVGGSTAQRRRRRQGEARAALPHAAQRLRDAGGEGGAGQGEEDRHRMRRSVRSACDFHQVRPRRAPAAAEPAGQVAAALAGRRPDLEAADALPGQHQSVVLHPRRRPSCLGTAPSAATW
mmetsp:Transcript_25594/g.67925  ORF Transcript_25594/g.67925 Transcript_25594/m.67925 type:complete len:397 (-) Transcript_25594:1122-2312(-)